VALYLCSPNTPSWRGAQLKHRENFTFTYVLQVEYSFTDAIVIIVMTDSQTLGICSQVISFLGCSIPLCVLCQMDEGKSKSKGFFFLPSVVW
jgi:hypothetical protein